MCERERECVCVCVCVCVSEYVFVYAWLCVCVCDLSLSLGLSSDCHTFGVSVSCGLSLFPVLSLSPSLCCWRVCKSVSVRVCVCVSRCVLKVGVFVRCVCDLFLFSRTLC